MLLTTRIKAFVNETGKITRFAGIVVVKGFRPRYEIKEFLNQSFIIGYNSLGLVGLTAFIMGLVITMQLQPILINYGIDGQMPLMLGIAIVREIGPVITALIFAGKIGSSIGAELGSMSVTEQIDAMAVSGTNPIKYLVATRIAATTLMLPVLTVFADAICLYGSFVGINIRKIMEFNLFFSQVFQILKFSDLIPSLVKTLFFGFAVGLIGSYQGYHSKSGTRGVGSSANSTVVISSVLVFIIDLVAVQITSLLGLN